MKTITLIFAALATLLLASCNTMEGMGQDMQQAGQGIERSANR